MHSDGLVGCLYIGGGEGLGLRGDCVGEVVFLSFVFTCKK